VAILLALAPTTRLGEIIMSGTVSCYSGEGWHQQSSAFPKATKQPVQNHRSAALHYSETFKGRMHDQAIALTYTKPFETLCQFIGQNSSLR
jgi:hypothetical protein